MLDLPRPVRRVAVFRANGLGDFLFATPALRSLAKGFPEARITYLCRPDLQAFVEGRYAYLHRVVAVPYYPKLNNPPPNHSIDERAIDPFFRQMAAEKFDLAIQMHGGGTESNPFVERLGALHTLGLRGLEAAPLETNLRYVFYQGEVFRYLELVSQLGIPWDGIAMDLPLLGRDFDALSRNKSCRALEQYAVLHPGASDLRRRWPVDRFARVAEHVRRRFGLVPVVGGSSSETELARRIQEMAGVGVIDTCGQLDVGAYAALISGARLFLGNDTGPAHAAFALGVPSVVIYWCGNLITAGPPTREKARPVLSWTIDCPSCGRRECGCRVSFVQDAPLEEVLGQVDDLLAEQEIVSLRPNRLETQPATRLCGQRRRARPEDIG